jgi:hypothetical protein
MSAKQRHATGRKQVALASETTFSKRASFGFARRFTLFPECHFFRHTRGCDHERPAMASFAVAQSPAGHEHLTVIVTFSLPANVIVRPCVLIMFRARRQPSTCQYRRSHAILARHAHGTVNSRHGYAPR